MESTLHSYSPDMPRSIFLISRDLYNMFKNVTVIVNHAGFPSSIVKSVSEANKSFQDALWQRDDVASGICAALEDRLVTRSFHESPSRRNDWLALAKSLKQYQSKSQALTIHLRSLGDSIATVRAEIAQRLTTAREANQRAPRGLRHLKRTLIHISQHTSGAKQRRDQLSDQRETMDVLLNIESGLMALLPSISILERTCAELCIQVSQILDAPNATSHESVELLLYSTMQELQLALGISTIT
ncbi:unnamed protein product [Somion occarium]|uniref:Uncharacterized protein n=1 Tax=Somion occarium TaxID=3059160 RepID=A0ABP1E8B6_9APHY